MSAVSKPLKFFRPLASGSYSDAALKESSAPLSSSKPSSSRTCNPIARDADTPGGHARHAIALYYLTAYPELAKAFEADKDKRLHFAKVQSEIRKIKRDRARALALQTAPVFLR